MKNFILRIWEPLRRWTLRWAYSKHALSVLFFIAFIEASFFPIPPDILLVALVLTTAERWWFYALLTMAGSVLGSFLGYLIGWAFYATVGQYIVHTHNLQHFVDAIGTKYSQHVFLTILTGAIVFIPFKIFTITAGLFRVPILPMVLAAIIGRGCRYFAVAYLTKVFGKRIGGLIIRYFKIFSAVVLILIIIWLFIIKSLL